MTWLIVGGIVAAVVVLLLLLGGRRSGTHRNPTSGDRSTNYAIVDAQARQSGQWGGRGGI